ncbi:MAG TPA: DUF2079 domain-containing protein, partial [Leptospiraceae bacterium]|nr:DUF2079 domain-containing protein [Leptospiraceae bacterium]
TETTERSYAENVLAIVLISTFTLTGILFSIRCMDGLILGAYDYTGISLVAGGHLYGQFLSSPYYQSANGSIFYLAHHFSPILAFYSPFYYLTSSHAIYGILLQITAAIGMYAAYRFARAGLLAACAIVFLPVIYQFTISFHYEIFVLWFFFLLLGGIRKKQWVQISLGLLLLLMVKEDMSVYLSLFAVYLITGKDRVERKIGAVILAVCAVSFVCVSILYMPRASGEVNSRFLTYWGVSSLSDFIFSLTPTRVAGAWIDSWPVIISFIAQTAFLPLLRPRLSLLVLVPIFTLHLLSSQPFFHTLSAYYMYTFTPFLLYGAFEGAKTFKHFRSAAIAGFCAAAAFTASTRKEVPMVVLPDPSAGPEIRALLSKMEPGRKLWTHAFLSAQAPVQNPVFPLLHPTAPDYILIDPDRSSPQGESPQDVEKALQIARRGCIVGRASGTVLYRVSQELTQETKEKPCTRD